jgi:hypothetical protein
VRPGRLSLLAWSALSVAFLSISHLVSDPARLSTFLGDPDDATRMIEVREWMAGASWFGLTLPRLGGAHPLILHWSRIIDARSSRCCRSSSYSCRRRRPS